MRFEKGIHYPHPARGRARKPYAMSEAALRQRRENLKRIRSGRENMSDVIESRLGPACETPVTTREATQREAQELIRQAHKQNPGARPMTWQHWEESKRRGGRRVQFSVPVR